VSLDDRARDGEPEPGPADRSLLRGRRAKKALEQVALLGLRHADAGVRHSEQGVVAHARDRDEDATARRRELDRVRNEVVEQLAEPGPISVERRERGSLEDELHLLALGRWPNRVHRLGGDCGEVDLFALEREFARFDLGNEEEVAHDAQEAAAVSLHDAEKTPLLLGEVTGVIEHELEIARDRRKRRPKLVRDESDELVFKAVEFTEPLVLLDEKLVRCFRLGPGDPLLHQQVPVLGVHALELSNEPRHADEHEEGQDRCADDHSTHVRDVPVGRIEGEDRRRGERGRDERSHAKERQPGLGLGIALFEPTARMEGGGAEGHVADEPDCVEPQAGAIPGAGFLPRERSVCNDVTGEAEREEPGPGGLPPRREQ
jgi:hypothetical protein